MLRGTVAAALVCVLAGVAHADNKEAAKEAYSEGKRHYDLGEYDAALTAFKKAYLNYEEPVFLFNIAQCYRALGDRPAAVRSYRAFLRNWPKAPNREQVERIIAELDQPEAPPAPAATPPPTVTATAPSAGPDAKQTAAPAATATQPSPAPVTATATSEPKPSPSAKPAAPPNHDDLVGMVEVEPNFDRASGSSKPLRWWAWTLIVVAAGGVAAAAIVLGVTQSGSSSSFATTLPDYTARGLTVRF